jgi:hypothetical protein
MSKQDTPTDNTVGQTDDCIDQQTDDDLVDPYPRDVDVLEAGDADLTVAVVEIPVRDTIRRMYLSRDEARTVSRRLDQILEDRDRREGDE